MNLESRLKTSPSPSAVLCWRRDGVKGWRSFHLEPLSVTIVNLNQFYQAFKSQLFGMKDLQMFGFKANKFG